MDTVKKSMERAEILMEALPYIRRFYNKVIVINTEATPWLMTSSKICSPGMW